jgi:CheY-like chemotaxis protein
MCPDPNVLIEIASTIIFSFVPANRRRGAMSRYAIPSDDMINTQLSHLQQPQKPKILVVDDEPDNLDLLYRTFRRKFRVLKAESGIEALKILASEGEVAVIISDQRMPEMKGTEFLSKTVPQFPNTIRIILTGFTDVEDLVEAINSGQVYKYITKPWDPDELQTVVNHATETYQSLKVQEDAIHRAELQTRLLSDIVEMTGCKDDVANALTNLTRTFGEGFLMASCVLQLMDDGGLSNLVGSYHRDDVDYGGTTAATVNDDPLAHLAIAEKSTQLLSDITDDGDLSDHPFYDKTSTQSQIAIPLMSSDQVFAIFSLRWETPLKTVGIQAGDISLIFLLAKQLSLSLGYMNLAKALA